MKKTNKAILTAFIAFTLFFGVMIGQAFGSGTKELEQKAWDRYLVVKEERIKMLDQIPELNYSVLPQWYTVFEDKELAKYHDTIRMRNFEALSRLETRIYNDWYSDVTSKYTEKIKERDKQKNEAENARLDAQHNAAIALAKKRINGSRDWLIFQDRYNIKTIFSSCVGIDNYKNNIRMEMIGREMTNYIQDKNLKLTDEQTDWYANNAILIFEFRMTLQYGTYATVQQYLHNMLKKLEE